MPSLNQVFIKDISVFCCIELSLYPDKSPGSAAEKHPNRMMQPQACFTMGGGGGYCVGNEQCMVFSRNYA